MIRRVFCQGLRSQLPVFGDVDMNVVRMELRNPVLFLRRVSSLSTTLC